MFKFFIGLFIVIGLTGIGAGAYMDGQISDGYSEVRRGESQLREGKEELADGKRRLREGKKKTGLWAT